MVEGGEHPNTKESMNTQELLNTMVASQIQLREDMNLIMQQFQNLKGGQEENKTDHIPNHGGCEEDQQEDKQGGRDDQESS